MTVKSIPSNSHTVARKLQYDDRWLQVILLAFMVLYYGVVLSDLGLGSPASSLNLTFNSMLQHLLHGQFDVDPNIVGVEGFLRNGHVYAYWGIWCALIRLPLFLVRRMDVDVTVWSCLVAVCLAGMMKVRAVLFIRRRCAVTAASEWVFGVMLAYVVLGGSAVGYLRASLYQEVVFWAAAFGAVFVYFAVKGVVSGRFTAKMLSWMALCAGLALLTRVSTGIGLCMAFGLLLLVLLAEEMRAGSAAGSSQISGLLRAMTSRRILMPAMILIALLIVAGIVNHERWGHATVFADHRLYLGNIRFPDRMPRTSRYGYFNVVRIPFGLLYYFLPLWVLRGPNGYLLFENTNIRLMDSLELPPSSFFLTDLLPMAFIAFLVYALWTRRAQVLQPFGRWLAVAAGLVAPCLLMLTAISMNYRYRMEFYPEMDLLAFLGLYAIASDEELLGGFMRRRRWVIAALAMSIVGAFALMILYKLSDWGPSQVYLRNGLIHYYASTMRP